MARISTGQTYGDTSRSTAAQLLGGIPIDATPGAIAQGAIAAPSLQPRATPAQTFQQVGAPILGGAPKFFAPPDLPNPGQDMANLAKALGGFSTTLQGFGESWLAKTKEDSKQAEQQATGLVTKYGPARDLAVMASAIEKKVALGGPGAPQAAKDLQLLREMQNNSIGRVWLERSSEQNAILESAMSLSSRLESTTTIDVGGQKIQFNQLPTTDPRYREHRDRQLLGDMPISTATATKYQQLILNAQLQADEAHRKRYNATQATENGAVFTYNQGVIAKKYIDDYKTTPLGAYGALQNSYAQQLQVQIDTVKLLPLTQEDQQKQITKLVEDFPANVLAAAKSRGLYVKDLDALVKPVLQQLFTGPPDQRIMKDGKSPNEALRLVNTLGGEPYLDQLISKANAQQIQGESQKSQVATINAQQQYNDARELAKKNGTLGAAFFDGEKKAALNIADPYLRNARVAAIEADEKDYTAVYIAPAQAQKTLYFTQQLALTQSDDKARNKLQAQIQEALDRKQITGAAAISLQGSINAQDNKDVRAYDGAINKQIDIIRKREMAYYASPASYGDSTITSYEMGMLNNLNTKGFQGAQDEVAKAIQAGKDPVAAINKYFETSNFGLTRRIDPAPSYQSLPQLLQQNTGSASRNIIDPLKANNLRGAAQNKQVLEQGAFMGEMDTWLRTGKPTEGFKTLMKALTGGGKKASDVILNQYRLHGISPDPAALERIKSLDGQKLSMATPQPRMTPQQNPALMGISIASRALGDLLAPPASAMQMPALPPLPNFRAAPPTPPPAIVTARPRPVVSPSARVDGYLKRLSYIETRLRNIPNAEGSDGMGYFQAFGPFTEEAIKASGGISPRDADYGRAAKATAAWIRVNNPKAWAAIRAGRYDEADRRLRNTWPSLPNGDQAQSAAVQKKARTYLQ
jgi:hypothetical protein